MDGVRGKGWILDRRLVTLRFYVRVDRTSADCGGLPRVVGRFPWGGVGRSTTLFRFVGRAVPVFFVAFSRPVPFLVINRLRLAAKMKTRLPRSLDACLPSS